MLIINDEVIWWIFSIHFIDLHRWTRYHVILNWAYTWYLKCNWIIFFLYILSSVIPYFHKILLFNYSNLWSMAALKFINIYSIIKLCFHDCSCHWCFLLFILFPSSSIFNTFICCQLDLFNREGLWYLTKHLYFNLHGSKYNLITFIFCSLQSSWLSFNLLMLQLLTSNFYIFKINKHTQPKIFQLQHRT